MEIQKKGKGFRINASYINPWATTQSPIVAAITGLTRTGDYVEGAVDKAFQDAVINPIREAFSPSMLAESLISLLEIKMNMVDQFLIEIDIHKVKI